MRYIITFLLLFNFSIAFADDFSGEIKSYIANIKSVAIEFVQSDESDHKSIGMLIIDKPYKFRCNYYEPFPLVIVGNKNYVSVYDYEMQHLSRIKASENIFNFLLLDQVNFDGQFEILSESKTSGSYIIRLKHRGMDKVSEISFDIKSKDIKCMKILEENNIITLSFSKTHRITNVSKSLFIMKDPDIFGKPERFDKAVLQKKFNLVN
ncbi:outer-membrane lipoprotein carrier protein LolA [Rickettsiaceae bacterium]|nr:outer-membrane lipoprotein carrier protein LolA [Rickettsiaceae bacterium]